MFLLQLNVQVQIQIKPFFSLTFSKSLLFNVGKPRINDTGAEQPQRRNEGKTDYKGCRSNQSFLWQVSELMPINLI